jgi:hypothetical protein
MAQESKNETFSFMQLPGGYDYDYEYTSPRLVNRQMKYFFSALQRIIQNRLLCKLQEIFNSSEGCSQWLAAFVVVVGIGMAFEDQQKTIQIVHITNCTENDIDPTIGQTGVDEACKNIDESYQIILCMFWCKYRRDVNPLRDSCCEWDNQAGFDDASNRKVIQDIKKLVEENRKISWFRV